MTDWYPQIPTITLTWTDKNYLLPPKKDIFETLKKTTTATENFSSSSSTFILKHFNFHHQQTSLKREQFQPSSKCLNQVTILKTCLLNIFLQLQSFLIFRLRILTTTFEAQNSVTATQIIIKKLNPNWSTTYFCKMCKMSSSEKYISSWFCFFYRTTNFRDFLGVLLFFRTYWDTG